MTETVLFNGAHLMSLMWWMLTQKVWHKHGTFSCEHPWKVTCNLYFFRVPKGTEKEAQAVALKPFTKEGFQDEWTAPVPKFTATQSPVPGWAEGGQVSSVPMQQFPTEEWRAPLTAGRLVCISHCLGCWLDSEWRQALEEKKSPGHEQFSF